MPPEYQYTGYENFKFMLKIEVCALQYNNTIVDMHRSLYILNMQLHYKFKVLCQYVRQL